MDNMDEDMEMKTYPADAFEVLFIAEHEFVPFVKSQNAELASIDGKFRWIITRENGTRYVIQPSV